MDAVKTGTITLSTSNGFFTVRVLWEERYDKGTGKTFIAITDLQATSSEWIGVTYFLDGSISVNGAEVITFNHTEEKHYVYWESKNTFASVGIQKGGAPLPWISADLSRCKNVTIEVNISGYIVNEVWAVEDAEAVELTYTGVVRIDGELYQTFVDTGSGFNLLLPNIDDGSKFELYSG